MISTIDTVHLGVAFLVLLGAVAFGWVQLGRRVMVALIGLQVLVGLIYAGTLGKATPPAVLGHIVVALAAMAAYIVGRRLGERSRGPLWPMLLSAIGLLLVLLAAYMGLRMHGRIA